MTDEQINTLRWVCGIQDDVRRRKWGALFFSTWSDYRLWRYIDTECQDNPIIEALAEVGLPKLDWVCHGDWYANDADYHRDENGDLIPIDPDTEPYDDALAGCEDVGDNFVATIQEYLYGIDEQYGTNFAG